MTTSSYSNRNSGMCGLAVAPSVPVHGYMFSQSSSTTTTTLPHIGLKEIIIIWMNEHFLVRIYIIKY
jgi:hypothetical protein